ncbi:MAG TPA: M4 family metallopeptidase, partial [Chitinophagales bacterium]|nr:M4 family metallopeptidase [Chitinophagales bacterium]
SNVRSWQAGRHSSLPEYIAFTDNANLPLSALPKWLRYQFQLNEDFGLQLLEQQSDALGMEHYRYQQTYQGHPIEGAIYLAHTRQQQIVSLNGVLVRSFPNGGTVALTTDLALQKAINHIGAQHYRWQSPAQEAALQREQHNPAATYYPKGELVFCSSSNSATASYRLCYKFDIYADQPLQRYYVFVDAQTGEIIQKLSRLCHTDTPATAITKYSGTRQITTDNTGTTYRLREAGRGNGIETYNCQQQTDFINTDFTDADNYWNNVNAARDEAATDAHWGAEMTYDFFLSTHNRQGIDNNNMPIISYVHYGSNYFNAFWDGDRMAYGDGSGSAGPLTALDIAGHEMTHGVTQFSAGLNYINESGALNEAFSDIFGTVIEFYARPTNANWLVGSDIGSTFRSMSNPNAYSQPDTYNGTNWYVGSGDNGGVHTNSGVANYWFYLLTTGGSGTNDLGNAYTVSGIGMDKAQRIAYRALNNYLFPTVNYANARFYSILSAIDLYGACSPEVVATTNAWYAVGVGNVYDGIVTADF